MLAGDADQAGERRDPAKGEQGTIDVGFGLQPES
jgi:hypothetical protein